GMTIGAKEEDSYSFFIIGNVFWSLAKLNLDKGIAEKIIEKIIADPVPTAVSSSSKSNNTALFKCIWGSAHLELQNNKAVMKFLLKLIENFALPRMDSLDGRQLSTIVWSLGKLNLFHGEPIAQEF